MRVSALRGVKLVLEPFLHIVRRHEDTLESAEFTLEVRMKLFGKRMYPEVFRSFRVAHDKAQGGVVGPVIKDKIVGEIFF